MKIKIKYEKVTNPSPVVGGWSLFIDGVKIHIGYFITLDALRDFWADFLVKKGFWSQRHDLAGVVDNYFLQRLAVRPIPPYYVQTWSRDCDMYESTSVRRIDSYIDLIKDYRSFCKGAEWAEGPRSWELIDPVPEGHWNRDRAMEAYENGKGSSIYV